MQQKSVKIIYYLSNVKTSTSKYLTSQDKVHMQQRQMMKQAANLYLKYKTNFYQKRAFATQQPETKQI